MGDGAVKPKWIRQGLQFLQHGVHDDPASTGTAHNAMATVAAIQEEARDGRRSEEWSVVGCIINASKKYGDILRCYIIYCTLYT